ncbi:hypothetical protein ADL27_38425 [Streptomyces sp. NRRL F-6602]|nr:hypothetical protein ADL27_38425 [Streptomyces sp. NRRL F-6602]
MGNIGLIGRARVGKDTAGQWLVDNRGYRRVSFAGPLKEAALRINPIVRAVGEGDGFGAYTIDLLEVIEDLGWEAAKDQFPEVRRILQELGMAVRDLDPEFWLRQALAKVTEANEAGVPVVITDVRFPNEAESLRRAGFHLAYIDRPGMPQLDHESEKALTVDDADYTILNCGPVEDLHGKVEVFAQRVYAIESRRHGNRVW